MAKQCRAVDRKVSTLGDEVSGNVETRRIMLEHAFAVLLYRTANEHGWAPIRGGWPKSLSLLYFDHAKALTLLRPDRDRISEQLMRELRLENIRRGQEVCTCEDCKRL